jgi:hypothetical protein
MFKKALVSFLLLAIAVPAGLVQAAAYVPYGGQTVEIARPSLNPASFKTQFADLRTVSAQTFGISIFGNDYSVDISAAQLSNAANTPVTYQSFVVGHRVTVIGALDATNPMLIHAVTVRDFGLTSTTPSGDTASSTADDFDAEILAASASSGGCEHDDICQLMEAMYQHAIGRDMSNLPVVRDTQNVTVDRWNSFGGSQNITLVAHAAANDYGFFEELANFSKSPTGGIYNRELGTDNFYFDAPMAAFMVALRDAKAAGDTEAANAIAGYMRSTWALWSLATVPAHRSTGWLNLSGEIQTSSGGGQSTPQTAVAGERWRTYYGENQPELRTNVTSAWLSWALDLQRGGGNIGNSHWSDGTAARIAGVTSYRQTTPPEVWGLSAADRTLFQSIINGNRSRLSEVLDIIKQHGVFNHVIRIRRTSNGVETINFKSMNGNKPTQAATIVTNGGDWKGIRPCWNNASSNPGYRVSVSNGIITATGSSPKCNTVSMPELDGNLIYSVVLSGNQAYEGNITSTDGAITPPPGGTPPPTPPTGTPPPPTPGQGGTSTSTLDSRQANVLIDQLLELRRETKALGFSRNPADKPRMLTNLVSMQMKIINLFSEVQPFINLTPSPQPIITAIGRVQPRFTEFNLVAIECTLPTSYVPFIRVSEHCKTGLEVTGGRFNDALLAVRAALPPPLPLPPGEISPPIPPPRCSVIWEFCPED